MRTMLITLLCTFYCMLCCCNNSNNNGIPDFSVVEKNGKWGVHKYADSTSGNEYDRIYLGLGKTVVVTKPENYMAGNTPRIFLTEVVDTATLKSSYGVLANDTVVFKPGEYDSYEMITQKCFKVKKDSMYSVIAITASGERKQIISGSTFEPDWREGYFWVKSPNGQTLYSLDGKSVGPHKRIFLSNSKKSIFYQDYNPDEFGVMDIVTGLRFSKKGNFIENSYRFGNCYVLQSQTNHKEEPKTGVVDLTGHFVVPMVQMHGSYACRMGDSLFMYVDEAHMLHRINLTNASNLQTGISTTEMGSFSESHFCWIERNDSVGVYDIFTKKLIIPMQYERIYLQENFFSCYKKNDRSKYLKLDSTGKFAGIGFN